MSDWLVDTNVLYVANGQGSGTESCEEKCIATLRAIQDGHGRVVLDSLGDIVREYLSIAPFGSPQGVGDMFVVWVVTFQSVVESCVVVEVNEHESRGYVEFPDDVSLAGFDLSDRKFVACAVAHGEGAVILNATDSDWQKYSAQLATYVVVEQLCV